jgi:hypothetical protein
VVRWSHLSIPQLCDLRSVMDVSECLLPHRWRHSKSSNFNCWGSVTIAGSQRTTSSRRLRKKISHLRFRNRLNWLFVSSKSPFRKGSYSSKATSEIVHSTQPATAEVSVLSDFSMVYGVTPPLLMSLWHFQVPLPPTRAYVHTGKCQDHIQRKTIVAIDVHQIPWCSRSGMMPTGCRWKKLYIYNSTKPINSSDHRNSEIRKTSQSITSQFTKCENQDTLKLAFRPFLH